MRTTPNIIKKEHGFTAIEVIATILIIGILASLGLSRMYSGVDDFEVVKELRVLKAHLRHAQTMAMNSTSDWGIYIGTSATYRLFEGSTGNWRTIQADDSDGDDTTVTLGSLTISSSPQTITFSNSLWGSPGAATITITTNSASITVTKNTGFIP